MRGVVPIPDLASIVAAQLPTPPVPTTIPNPFLILPNPASPKKLLFCANCSIISSSSKFPPFRTTCNHSFLDCLLCQVFCANGIETVDIRGRNQSGFFFEGGECGVAFES